MKELIMFFFGDDISKVIEYVDVPFKSKIVYWSLESETDTEIFLEVFNNNDDNLISDSDRPKLNGKFNECIVNWPTELNVLDMIKVNVVHCNNSSERIVLRLKLIEL
jgi:hypothetical protein